MHFLQSKEWEEFQKGLGREVFRVDGMLVVKLPLVFGKNYLYSAGAQNLQAIFAPGKGETFSTPLFYKSNDSPLKSQKWLADFAGQENAVFLKLEPMTEEEAMKLLKPGFNKSFNKSGKEVQPQRTIVLDLTKSEEELLAGMHQKTRYNLRLASRKDLRFKIYDLRNDNEQRIFLGFWQLLNKTSRRDSFYAHEKSYYKKLLGMSLIKLCGVEYNRNLVAANIALFYGDTAYYLHGASDYDHRNLMAPYLLHWETIKYAKERGYKNYDFWGIDEKKWPGVTRFKRGFGGREINYIGSFDYVFQPLWYKLYNLRNRLKKMI